jgi:hypothetical protein
VGPAAYAERLVARPRLTEQRWRWPSLLGLTLTVPAFYGELLLAAPQALAPLA